MQANPVQTRPACKVGNRNGNEMDSNNMAGRHIAAMDLDEDSAPSLPPAATAKAGAGAAKLAHSHPIRAVAQRCLVSRAFLLYHPELLVRVQCGEALCTMPMESDLIPRFFLAAEATQVTRSKETALLTRHAGRSVLVNANLTHMDLPRTLCCVAGLPHQILRARVRCWCDNLCSRDLASRTGLASMCKRIEVLAAQPALQFIFAAMQCNAHHKVSGSTFRTRW